MCCCATLNSCVYLWVWSKDAISFCLGDFLSKSILCFEIWEQFSSWVISKVILMLTSWSEVMVEGCEARLWLYEFLQIAFVLNMQWVCVQGMLCRYQCVVIVLCDRSELMAEKFLPYHLIWAWDGFVSWEIPVEISVICAVIESFESYCCEFSELFDCEEIVGGLPNGFWRGWLQCNTSCMTVQVWRESVTVCLLLMICRIR